VDPVPILAILLAILTEGFHWFPQSRHVDNHNNTLKEVMITFSTSFASRLMQFVTCQCETEAS